ncbi:MAG TPA: phasin family protein [Burkholderiaceae bacterium]|jgi:phasin family protein|nr:phasin family protein [Burkholderiaceae bacterium]
MNNVTPEQMLNSIKQSQAAMVEMAARSIECMEKHLELNLKAAKANLADATEASSQLMSVKDFPELYAVAQTVGQPAVGKAAAYNRNIYNINAEAATEFAKLVESRIEEANKAMASAVNDLSKNAPAGTEGMVAMMKSAFAASNSAFDAINKATKQVVEMVETNVEAATKAGEAAVSSASPKKSARRTAE